MKMNNKLVILFACFLLISTFYLANLDSVNVSFAYEEEGDTDNPGESANMPFEYVDISQERMHAIKVLLSSVKPEYLFELEEIVFTNNKFELSHNADYPSDIREGQNDKGVITIWDNNHGYSTKWLICHELCHNLAHRDVEETFCIDVANKDLCYQK